MTLGGPMALDGVVSRADTGAGARMRRFVLYRAMALLADRAVVFIEFREPEFPHLGVSNPRQHLGRTSYP